MRLNTGDDFAGYRIDAVVGRGGMGIVYRAQQQRPRRNVALKVIAADLSADTQFRERFEREAELAASIEHPNIVPVYEVGEHAGQLFIAMRFVDGPDLASVLHDGPVTPYRAVSIVERLASALGAAHQAGLIHRDVKPANVLIRRSGDDEHVYLTDFGLARRVESSGGGLTGTGQFMGTPGYAAPEQIRALPLDARTDVYALGCVLYELLAGQRPFPRRDTSAVMYAHVNEQAPPPTGINPDLPPRVDDVVAMALAKDPGLRFASTSALARAAAGAIRSPRDAAICRSCISPIPAGVALCPHCGEPATPPPGPHETVPLTGTHATVPRAAAHPTAEHPARVLEQGPPPPAKSRRGLWVIPAAALAAVAGVFLVLALTNRDPSTPAASADNTANQQSANTSDPPTGAVTNSGTADTSSSSAGSRQSTPVTTATSTPTSEQTAPAPTAQATAAATRTPRENKSKTSSEAPVPEVPVARTIAFHTGLDSGRSLPAAYCRISSGQLTCWTPNDGYTLQMSVSGAPIRARGEEPTNKLRTPDGYDRLGFGNTRSRYGFRCTSRASGLSCQNSAGHGFTLPRYVGLPALY